MKMESDAQAALLPALRQGAEALGLDLSERQSALLLAYLALLQRWNAVYNLTAVREPERMLTQHLIDCLAVFRPLSAQMDAGVAVTAGQPALATQDSRETAVRLLDVGSGGGLPGVVLALLAPAWDVTCIDTVAKKASFIRQVAAELALANLHAEHARVEAYRPPRPFGVITSRAFASLADFTAWTGHLLAPGGVWLAMKGAVPDDEISALPATVEVFHVEQLQVPGLDARRCLVWMRPRGGLA